MREQEFEHWMKQLDRKCYNCNDSSGIITGSREGCDICYSTGYQPTRAGVELLNFLRRQRKRIERERV